MKILIIEDDRDLSALVQLHLRDLGFEAEAAFTGHADALGVEFLHLSGEFVRGGLGFSVFRIGSFRRGFELRDAFLRGGDVGGDL